MTVRSVITDPADALLGSKAHGAHGVVARRGPGVPGGAAALPDGETALLAELPVALAVALRLHRAGHADAVIATALDIPPESVPTTLHIAGRKLEQLAGA